jgi:hypothetical protein
MAEQQDFWKQWDQIVARAWADDAFRRRLVADPTAVLQEHGIAVPTGVGLRVVEDTASQVHLVLPAKPSDEELSEDDLGRVAAAYCRGCGGCRSCGGCRTPLA